MDKNINNSVFNAEVPESVDNAFKNLTEKLTLNIGDTLSDIWYMVFGSISYHAEKKRIKYSHSLKQFHQEPMPFT